MVPGSSLSTISRLPDKNILKQALLYLTITIPFYYLSLLTLLILLPLDLAYSI